MTSQTEHHSDEYACYCSKVTRAEVRQAVLERGAMTVKDVCRVTGAMHEPNCKELSPLGICCHGTIQGIIDECLSTHAKQTEG